MHQNHSTKRILIGILALVIIGLVTYAVLSEFLPANIKTTNVVPTPIGVATSSLVSTTTAAANVPSTVPITASPTPSPTTPTAPPSGEKLVISNKDNSGTVYLTKGQEFTVALNGNLKWNINFEPAGIVELVASDTPSGTQGTYKAIAPGTASMHATGSPICNPDQACPMFVVLDTTTVVVK